MPARKPARPVVGEATLVRRWSTHLDWDPRFTVDFQLYRLNEPVVLRSAEEGPLRLPRMFLCVQSEVDGTRRSSCRSSA